ncbi:hypothetical protein C8J56DRAFT_586171 [Mycena floridula]|nr:hypothetical protein C8J56DRAFT_586171 [Mycena floridula]
MEFFSDFLATNDTPNEEQSQRLRESLDAQDVEVAHLVAEITRMQLIVDRKLKAAAPYRLALSALRRFPAELLSEIFIHCTPVDESSPPRPDTSPLLLCAVSSRWRAIAISTPALWSQFSTFRRHPVGFDGVCELFKLFLVRSGSRPLSISFQLDPSASVAFQKQFLDICMSQISRWKHFALRDRVTPDVVIPFAPISPGQILPHLEKFNFIFLASHVPWAISIVRSATSSLRELFWRGPSTQLSTMYWPKLVNLDLGNSIFGAVPLAPSMILAMLRQCPALEECILFIGFQTDRSSFPYIILSHLQSVTIIPEENIYVELSLFFDALRLPALQTLSVEGHGTAEIFKWPNSSFISLLRRSGCSLHSLTLRNLSVECDDKGLGFGFTQTTMGNLEKLSIMFDNEEYHGAPCAHVPDTLLQSLTWVDERRLLPNLKNATLMVKGYQVSLCRRMVKSRLNGENNIHLEMGTASPFEGNEIRLAATSMRKAGLNVEVERSMYYNVAFS